MDDFMTLVKRGVIYDGCPIVAKGTVKIRNGDVCIESMHNLMAVDGKNFAELCQPGLSKTEQGQVIDKEDWKARAEELQEEKELLSNGMKKTIDKLQSKLEHELSLRASIEEYLSREKKVSEQATHVMHDAESKLASAVSENETLKAQLAEKEGLVKELQSRLESEGDLLAERGQKIQSLIHEKESEEKMLQNKSDKMVSLQGQLDSTVIILSEKEEKLQSLQQELGKKSAEIKTVSGKEKDAKVVAEELQNKVALLEAERMEDKKNSAIMLDDFSEWRSTTEEEVANLKKEIEHNKTTITTLKNELEIAVLEESEFNATITTLHKENDELRKQLQLAAVPQGAPSARRAKFKQDFMSNLSFAF